MKNVYNTLSKIFKQKHTQIYVGCFLILIAIGISYGQTLQMYFWQDDSAVIFKLQNPEGAAGSYGRGFWERGPYRYTIVPFVPFFPIFNLEPFGYFLGGLVTYIFATVAFYLFTQQFFDNKKLAFLATLVFGAGYIGSDTMFRIANSWQTNMGLALALLTFWIFTKYLKDGGIKYYILSIFVYLFTVEAIYVRSHSIILPILFLDILFKMVPFKLQKIPFLILRQIPFWVIFYFWYLRDESFGGPGIKTFILDVFLQRNIEKVIPLFANIGNVLIPDVLQTQVINIVIKILPASYSFSNQIIALNIVILLFTSAVVILLGRLFTTSIRTQIIALSALLICMVINIMIYSKDLLWYRDQQSVVAGLIGVQSLVLVLFVAYVLFKKYTLISFGLIFGWIIIGSQIFGYLLQYPTLIFPTTHRYFSYSFIGYSLIYGTVLFGAYLLIALKKYSNLKIFGRALFLLIIGSNLFLGFRYQYQIVKDRSIPSRNFYKVLKEQVPVVKKGDVFFFDVYKDAYYQKQFGDFFSVGSMPESTALAIYYGVDRYDVSMLTEIDELISKIDAGEYKLDNVHSFYYGPNGLENTSKFVKDNLEEGSTFVNVTGSYNKSSNITKLENGTLGSNINITLKPESINSTTPMLLEFDLTAIPLNTPNTFPYYQNQKHDQESQGQIAQMLDYIKSMQDYYKNTKIKSTSEWKFREVVNALDNNLDTVWQGHRIWWNDHENEQLEVDMGAVKHIKKVIWYNWQPSLTPTSYTLEISNDGKDWLIIKEVKDGGERKSGEMVIEEFTDPVNARFVRMDISSTLTNDSPAILEFEVVEDFYTEIDPALARVVYADPFAVVNSESEWRDIFNSINDIGYFTSSWITDRYPLNETTRKIHLNMSGYPTHYELVVPAAGTKLESIELSFNIPLEVYLNNVKIKNLSLQELKARGAIKTFTEN